MQVMDGPDEMSGFLPCPRKGSLRHENLGMALANRFSMGRVSSKFSFLSPAGLVVLRHGLSPEELGKRKAVLKEHEEEPVNRDLPLLVPNSLQRIRCFMNTRGQLGVKPWADVNETLDAFFCMLACKSHDESFWNDLESLFTRLSADLKLRLAAKANQTKKEVAGNNEKSLVDNEVLDASRYHDLLGEIRQKIAVAQNQTRPGGFRALTAALSAPAIGLLMLMGGVVSLGCSESLPSDPGETETETITLPDTGTAEDTESDTESIDEETDTEPGDAGPRRTLAEMVESVVQDEEKRESLLDCFDTLHESWRTGLEDLFRDDDDHQIAYYLDCLLGNTGRDGGWCKNPEEAGEFDLDLFINNCATLVYLGVRFE